MATLITILKSGGRYDATWVERLARGIRRHAPAFRRILCLTDLPLAVEGVERVPLRHDWPVWWAKMEAFRPGLTEGPALLCDLDTVLTGPADALAGWIREQVGHASSIRGLASALQAAMDEGSGCFAPCTTRLCCAAETLLTAAREVGAVRADIDADDLLRLGHAIAAVADAAPEKAERLVSVLISGLRPECPSGLLPQPRR